MLLCHNAVVRNAICTIHLLQSLAQAFLAVIRGSNGIWLVRVRKRPEVHCASCVPDKNYAARHSNKCPRKQKCLQLFCQAA